MYARWQMQEAKQKLSQLVRAAESEGPQVITRQGEDAVVVVSLADFARLRGEPGLKALLRSAPDFEQLGLYRSTELAQIWEPE